MTCTFLTVLFGHTPSSPAILTLLPRPIIRYSIAKSIAVGASFEVSIRLSSGAFAALTNHQLVRYLHSFRRSFHCIHEINFNLHLSHHLSTYKYILSFRFPLVPPLMSSTWCLTSSSEKLLEIPKCFFFELVTPSCLALSIAPKVTTLVVFPVILSPLYEIEPISHFG